MSLHSYIIRAAIDSMLVVLRAPRTATNIVDHARRMRAIQVMRSAFAAAERLAPDDRSALMRMSPRDQPQYERRALTRFVLMIRRRVQSANAWRGMAIRLRSASLRSELQGHTDLARMCDEAMVEYEMRAGRLPWGES